MQDSSSAVRRSGGIPASGYRIPFNRPGLVGHELTYIADAILRGHSAGDGSYTSRCHDILQRELRCHRALLTTSCTHALEMCALLLDVRPGDEVIVPSFTFVSTANAFVLRGAKPVFIDVRADTLNLDETLLEQCITPRTKAIVPVHYAGIGCEMDAITAVAERHGVKIVEDNAHGLFARYKGKYLGTFGQLSHAELSRNQECNLWRGRSPHHQRSALRGARRNHPRKGDQPQPLLPR